VQGTDAHAEHMHKELMRALSIRVKKLNNKLIFLPQNHLPMKTLWYKNQEKFERSNILRWGTFKISLFCV
jgi:hypothetical protein